MERDLQKILETLKRHEADNAFLNDICVMLLTNQIDQLRTTKKTIKATIEDIKHIQKDLKTIKDFVVVLSEKVIAMENKS
mgnify:FL=1